jgi:uncharacterized protein with von Willebrand factor type A (vWA) domain
MRQRRYSRWDGSQDLDDLDALGLFDELSDQLLYHGDVTAALRDLLSRGYRSPSGRDIPGLADVLQQLRERREELLSSFGMTETYDRVREGLSEVLDEEGRALDEARQAGDPEASMKELELATLPSDLPGQVRALREYRFTSPEAAERFEQLLTEMREQLLQSTFSQMKTALGQQSPEDLGRLRDLLAELNELMERSARGESTDAAFSEFMSRYGDLLPPVNSLEELLALLQSQAEAMASFMNSLDPSQRSELEELFSELFGDLDLRWQMERFSENLSAMPGFRGDGRFGFRGDKPLELGQVGDEFSTLGRLDELERSLKNLTSPFGLSNIDLNEVEEALGPEARSTLEHLSKVAKQLLDAGLIERTEGYLQMSPQGLRRIGAKALEEVFRKVDGASLGQHAHARSGRGGDLEYQSRPYEFGDPFKLSLQDTLRNALRRQGGGLPLRLDPSDFEIEITESQVACSTVLLLDLSLSMPLRENFLPAKKMAMALHSLISSRFPRDYFGIVGFSEIAHELSPATLPQATWDYVYGTNIEHALKLARSMLARHHGTKQILLVTDGEPTAHILPSGEVFFSYPPAPETIKATLLEVQRCTRAKIVINSFVLDANDQLRSFVDHLTAINRGRVFYADPSNLGDYVLVDFLRSRTSISEKE